MAASGQPGADIRRDPVPPAPGAGGVEPELVPQAAGPLYPQPLSPTGRKVVVVGLLIVAAILVVKLRGLLSLVLAAALLAYLLAPAVDRLTQVAFRYAGRPLPRWAAILVVFVWLASLIAFAGFLFVPPLVEQVTRLARELPDYYAQVTNVVEDLRRVLRRQLPAEWRQALERYLGQLGSVTVGFVRQSVATLFGWLASVLALVLVPIFTFFMLQGAPGIRHRLLAWFPVRLRPEVDFLVSEVNAVMYKFLRGRLLVALAVAALVSVGTWLLGVPYPLVLGLAAGLLDLIPFVGPVVAAVPAVTLTLFESPTRALWVAGLYVLVQQIENFVLSPKIEGGELELNPGVVIFAATAAGILFGIVGVLLALPIAAIARILLIYLRAKLQGEPLRPLGAPEADDRA